MWLPAGVFGSLCGDPESRSDAFAARAEAYNL